MNFKNHKYLAHKIEIRPWGVECRIALVSEDGTELTKTISIPSKDTPKSEINKKVQRLLDEECLRMDKRMKALVEKSKMVK